MYICEKCGKEFNKKTQYTQHQKRKTPCIPLFSSVINKSITIDNSTFNEIKNYYDLILNIDKSTYKSSNDETTPIDYIYEMINKIPNEFKIESFL